MLQACMYNRKEYKIVCVGGVPSYLAIINGHGNKKSPDGVNLPYSTHPHDNLFEFANRAISRFRTNFPNAIIEPNFRIDIFMRHDGKLVVNELESLEAWYTGGVLVEKEKQASDFMRLSWSQIIVNCIKIFKNNEC